MWLIVGQIPIKAEWRHAHASLTLQDLAEAISIASTSLQQRRAISLVSFGQCPHSRSSRPELLCENKGLRPATLFKKRLWHRCFLVTFAKFLRTPFFTKHIQWLLLTFAPIKISYSNTVSNAWALICLVSWRMVVENSGAKSFILTCTFLRIIAFFIKI